MEPTPPVKKPAKNPQPTQPEDSDSIILLNKNEKVFSDLSPNTLLTNAVSSLSSIPTDVPQIRNELRVGQAEVREA